MTLALFPLTITETLSLLVLIATLLVLLQPILASSTNVSTRQVSLLALPPTSLVLLLTLALQDNVLL